MRSDLCAGASSSGALEGKTDVGQEMFNGAEEPCDRVALGCLAQVMRGHVQINLRARDQAMSKKIADRDEVDAFAHQV